MRSVNWQRPAACTIWNLVGGYGQKLRNPRPTYASLGRPPIHDAGWKLAILSNVDRDLIAGTLARFPVRVDLVVTAEDVGSYKPALGHFNRFMESSGSRSFEVGARSGQYVS